MKNVEEDQKSSVSEVREYPQFVGLKEEWNGLLVKRSRPSIFLKHEWFDAAWQWCQHTSAMRLLCVSRDRNLIAIAPFSATRARKYFIPHTQLSIIQVPDSQECDIIVGDESAAQATASIMGYLSVRKDWDIVVLPQLQSDSNLAIHVPAVCESQKLKFSINDVGENLEVDVTNDWQSYYAARSRRLKKSNNNCRNKIFADNNVVNLLWSADSESSNASTEHLLSASKRISSISWKKQTGLTLEQIGPGSFIDRLSEHAIRNNWLSIWGLEINDEIVATEYQLVHEGVVAALRADFDPSYASVSPGSYLNWQILETLFSQNHALYRMGPGSNSYKLRWADRTTSLTEIRIYNNTFTGHFFWIADQKILPLLRRLKGELNRFQLYVRSRRR